MYTTFNQQYSSCIPHPINTSPHGCLQSTLLFVSAFDQHSTSLVPQLINSAPHGYHIQSTLLLVGAFNQNFTLLMPPSINTASHGCLRSTLHLMSFFNQHCISSCLQSTLLLISATFNQHCSSWVSECYLQSTLLRLSAFNQHFSLVPSINIAPHGYHPNTATHGCLHLTLLLVETTWEPPSISLYLPVSAQNSVLLDLPMSEQCVIGPTNVRTVCYWTYQCQNSVL